MTLLNQQKELMKSLKPGAILKAQDKDKSIMFISLLLMKTAMLYQIPNWGEQQSVVLADWIYHTYHYDKLDSVIKTLNSPPIGDEKNWRLTPDTIQKWMEVELEKEAANREREIYNAKQQELNDVDLLLIEALKETKEEQNEVTHNRELRKKLVPLTEEEIKLEGQQKPYVKTYHRPSDEYAIMHKLHLEWIKANYDLEGNQLPGFLSEPEWLLLNHPPF